MPAPAGGRIGQHRVHRRRRAVHPELTGGDHPALLAHHQVGHRHDPVVEVLAADQVGDHPVPLRAGRAGRAATTAPRTRAPPRWSTTSARSPPGVGAAGRAISSSSSVVPAAAAELGGDVVGTRPQQRRRPVRPARRCRPPPRRRARPCRRPPGRSAAAGCCRGSARWSGSSTATPPGTSPTPTARRIGSDVKYASARPSRSSGAGQHDRRRAAGRGRRRSTAVIGSGP